MAGNEIEVCIFLFSSIGNIHLKHIGQLREIGAPLPKKQGYLSVQTLDDLIKIYTEDSRKKAAIYLNGIGVSIKQIGGSNLFNRLQRAKIIDVFSSLGFSSPQTKVTQLDREVYKFHECLLASRNCSWQDFFTKSDFQELLKFLMMKASPIQGISKHPAELILEAPQFGLTQHNIQVYSFDEYFHTYKHKIVIAIRRQWVGQDSESEHKRALGISKKPGNSPWVFDNVAGQPRLSTRERRWREDYPESERITVHFLMIEKLK